MAIVIVTDRFIPTRFGAYVVGPVVLIRPRCKDDKCLMAHELVHVKQFWRNPLMGLFYQFSKKYRLKYELEAFKAQIECGASIVGCAMLLSDNYGLDISFNEALELLNTAHNNS